MDSVFFVVSDIDAERLPPIDSRALEEGGDETSSQDLTTAWWAVALLVGACGGDGGESIAGT